MLAEDQLEVLEGTFQQRVDAFCRQLIREAMKQSGGNQAQAARLSGLTYDQFRYYRRKYAVT